MSHNLDTLLWVIRECVDSFPAEVRVVHWLPRGQAVSPPGMPNVFIVNGEDWEMLTKESDCSDLKVRDFRRKNGK